jgi:hypothetical protein
MSVSAASSDNGKPGSLRARSCIRAFGRAARALAIAALVSLSPAMAQSQQKAAPKPAQIDRNGVLMLVRSTLLALDHANKTGNYTVLRDIAAPGFQAGNNPSRLAEIFAKLRNDRLDLSGVAVIDPQLSLLPQIEANGLMHMAGFFPSVPAQVNFELMYAPLDGQWRLFGISVSVGQSAPAAPAPPEPPAAQKQPPPNKGAKQPAPVAPPKP